MHSLHRRAIQKNEINALPRKTYTGPIHVVDSDAKMRAAVELLAFMTTGPKVTMVVPS